MGCHRNKEKEGSPLFFYCHDRPPALSRHFKQREIFSVPPFPSSFARPFTGSTVHLSAIRCFPFLAVKHSPSYRQRKRSLDFARDDDTGNVLFPHILCMMYGIVIPHAVISSAARNLFRPLFPTTPSLSRLWETPSTFLRYGVSHFSFSNTRRLTANEKDPSTLLGMTIREERAFSTSRDTVFPVSRRQTLSLLSPTKKIPRLRFR